MPQINTLQYLIINLLVCLVTILASFPAKATEPENNQYDAPIVGRSVDSSAYANSNNLWQRIRKGFNLTGFENKEIREIAISYTKHPKYMLRITERSKRYLYHIVEEVERRGMPTEIALLPIVESAFDPHAQSRRNAVGLWQFIPATGKSLGLIQNWWHDDRKDIVAATQAALDYLDNLYHQFDDWTLVLAAYNWGEGAIRRSMAKNRKKGLPTKFRHLTLPRETRNHIYRLIAIKNIIASPADFGIKLNPIPNQPYFDKIETSHHIGVNLVVELADISIAEFNALNPAFNQPVITVNDAPRMLLLPVDNTETFLSNLEEYNESLDSSHAFQINRENSIKEVSSHHHIDKVYPIERNSIMENNNAIYGQSI